MSRRKAKRKSKYLGHRAFGTGNVKNCRGSGNRGGRGNAGLCKHKFSWMVKYDPDHFGRNGFASLNRTDIDTINIYEINRKAILGKIEKKEGKYYFEFSGKVLGAGDLTVPVFIKALAWSKGVEEKIKKCGGEIIKLDKSR